MEGFFGADLGDVRVHADAQAAQAAASEGAEAYTIGRDIYFGEGKFDPASAQGKALLGHELTHVLQQRGRGPKRQGSTRGSGEALEKEAQTTAQRFETSATELKGTGFLVNRYLCSFSVNRPATDDETQRLQAISRGALKVCEEILRARHPDLLEGAARTLETVEVDIDTALAGHSDEDIIQLWGRRMAAAVAAKLSNQSTPTLAAVAGAVLKQPVRGKGQQPATTSITATTQTFDIEADDLDGAAAALQSLDEWGKTRWNVTYDYDATDGVATSVAVTARITVELPRWTTLSKQPRRVQAEWNRMLTALRRHENEHVRIAREQISRLAAEMAGKPESELADLHAQCLQELDTLSEAYDTRTAHGQSEGVTLDLSATAQPRLTGSIGASEAAEAEARAVEEAMLAGTGSPGPVERIAGRPDLPGRAFMSPDDTPPPATLDDAIRTGDSSELTRFRPFPPLTQPQLSGICNIILTKLFVTWDDETTLESAWSAYGPEKATREVDFQLWQRCVDRGAELKNVPWLKDLTEAFVPDITALTLEFLQSNLDLVEKEMADAGLPLKEGEEAKPPTEGQADDLRDMQAAAASVAHVQEEQENARKVYVGYSLQDRPPESKQYWMPVQFDPFHKPERPDPPEFDPNDPSPMKQKNPIGPIVPTQPYEPLRDAYDRGTAAVQSLVMIYPMIYAITREGKSADTKKFADAKDAKQAREQLSAALGKLRFDIKRAREMLGKEINPLDLMPVQEVLFAGGKPKDTRTTVDTARAVGWVNWGTEFARAMTTKQLEGHATTKALKALGYEALSQIAFMFGGFTPGAGGVALMLGGLWAARQKANMSTEEYKAMMLASKTAVAPGTELVTPEQVDEAKARSEADEAAYAMAFVNTAAGIAGAGSSWAGEALSAGKPMTVTARIPNVKERVQIRIIPKAQNALFEQEMAAAKTASDNGSGPKFHGEVPVGGDRRAFATDPPDVRRSGAAAGPVSPGGPPITRGADGFPLSRDAATIEYYKQIQANPGREVGLVQNKNTKSWAVSIGEETTVKPPEEGLYGKSKSLDPGGEWSFVKHYHPNFNPKTGKFEGKFTNFQARFPSEDDMLGAFNSSGRKVNAKGEVVEQGKFVSESIDWFDSHPQGDPATPPRMRSTQFGYSPGANKPYWIRYLNEAGTGMVPKRFTNLAEYRAFTQKVAWHGMMP